MEGITRYDHYKVSRLFTCIPSMLLFSKKGHRVDTTESDALLGSSRIIREKSDAHACVLRP